MKIRALFCLVAALPFATSASAVAISASDASSIRHILGTDLLLTFFAVKDGTEDRLNAEFDVSTLTGPVSSAVFEIANWRNIDIGFGSDGIVEAYAYSGDGSIVESEFSVAATFANSVIYNESSGPLMIDVTAAVNFAIANGWSYFGIQLQAGSSDRFDGGGSSINPAVTLNIEASPTSVPESSSTASLVLAGLAAVGLWHRRTKR